MSKKLQTRGMVEGDILNIHFRPETLPAKLHVAGKRFYKIYTTQLHCWTDRAYNEFLAGNIPEYQILELGLWGWLRLWFKHKFKKKRKTRVMNEQAEVKIRVVSGEREDYIKGGDAHKK